MPLLSRSLKYAEYRPALTVVATKVRMVVHPGCVKMDTKLDNESRLA
jgi:hypothetical protein